MQEQIMESEKGSAYLGNNAAFGYFTQKNTNMSVWLDYFCPPGHELESRRFIIPSVAKYLITSQSTSRLSAPDSLRYASAVGY
ncbi:hypothetical protein [Shewanella algae]|uniref:hypothetical protein n=1 Tax=Shewanella algae TaxID=38313 RepID=UPI0011C07464|nr:hypothetical protein [Shewanella algae]MBO2608842.1 hypothetical protein [Shewanella algae]